MTRHVCGLRSWGFTSKSAGPLSSKGKEAGASCVGMGSKLFPGARVKAADWQYVTDKCRETLNIISEICQK